MTDIELRKWCLEFVFANETETMDAHKVLQGIDDDWRLEDGTDVIITPYNAAEDVYKWITANEKPAADKESSGVDVSDCFISYSSGTYTEATIDRVSLPVKSYQEALGIESSEVINLSSGNKVDTIDRSMKPDLGFDPILLARVDETRLVHYGNESIQKRVKNILEKDDLVYIAELVVNTEAEMLKTPGFGRESLTLLRIRLADYRLKFGEHIPNFNFCRESILKLRELYKEEIAERLKKSILSILLAELG